MKQKATHPFLAADKVLCIVNVKPISVLAVLQRKVTVFSFSRYLPELSQGYFASFRPHDGLGKEGGPSAARLPSFLRMSSSAGSQGHTVLLESTGLAVSKAWKEACGQVVMIQVSTRTHQK